jgi:hypothetical protein
VCNNFTQLRKQNKLKENKKGWMVKTSLVRRHIVPIPHE